MMEAISLLPLYAFMLCGGTNVPFLLTQTEGVREEGAEGDFGFKRRN